MIVKYLKVIAIIGAISLWVSFSARSDYNWADLIVEQETPKGWGIIYKQDNFADLILPWTWIKTPVTGLWFINDSYTKKLNNEIYLIHTLRVSYDYSRTDREESLELINYNMYNQNILTEKSGTVTTKPTMIKQESLEDKPVPNTLLEFSIETNVTERAELYQ